MSSFSRAGIWILIGAVLVLPLYELADYTEVWQHDESLILPGLVFLIIGMAMLALKVLCEAFMVLLRTLGTRMRAPNRLQPACDMESHLSLSPPPRLLCPLLTDLRI